MYAPLETIPATTFSQLCRSLAVGAFSLHEKDSRQLSETQLKQICKQLPNINSKRPELSISFLRLLQVMLLTWSPAVLQICADIQLIPWLVTCILESLEKAGGGDKGGTVEVTSCGLVEKGRLAAVCLSLYIIARQRCGTLEESATATAALLITLLQDTPLVHYIYRYFVRISSHKNNDLSRSTDALCGITILWQLWAVLACALQRAVSHESPLEEELIRALLHVGVEKLILKFFETLTVISSLSSSAKSDVLVDIEEIQHRKKVLVMLIKLCRLTLSSLVESDSFASSAKPEHWLNSNFECNCPPNDVDDGLASATCQIQSTGQLLLTSKSICPAEVWLLKVHECTAIGIREWIFQREGEHDGPHLDLISLFDFAKSNDGLDIFDKFFHDMRRRRDSLRLGRCVLLEEGVNHMVKVGAPTWCRFLRIDMALGGLLHQCLFELQAETEQFLNSSDMNIEILTETITLARCFCTPSQRVSYPHDSPCALFNYRYLTDCWKGWILSVDKSGKGYSCNAFVYGITLRLYEACIVINSSTLRPTEHSIPSGVLLAEWFDLVCNLILRLLPPCGPGSQTEYNWELCLDWIKVLRNMIARLIGNRHDNQAYDSARFVFLRDSRHCVTSHLINFYSTILKLLIRNSGTMIDSASTRSVLQALLCDVAIAIRILAKFYFPPDVFRGLLNILHLTTLSTTEVTKEANEPLDNSVIIDLRSGCLSWVYATLLQHDEGDIDEQKLREHFSCPAWSSIFLTFFDSITMRDLGRSVYVKADGFQSPDLSAMVSESTLKSEVEDLPEKMRMKQKKTDCSCWGANEGITISVWFSIVSSVPHYADKRAPHTHDNLLSICGIVSATPSLQIFLCEGQVCMIVGRNQGTYPESRCHVPVDSSMGCVRKLDGDSNEMPTYLVVFGDLPLVNNIQFSEQSSFHHLVVRYAFSSGRVVACLNGCISSEQIIPYKFSSAPSPHQIPHDSDSYSMSVGVEVCCRESDKDNLIDLGGGISRHELRMGPLLVFPHLLPSPDVTILHAAGPRYSDMFANTPMSIATPNEIDSTCLSASFTGEFRDSRPYYEGAEVHLDMRYSTPILVDQVLFANRKHPVVSSFDPTPITSPLLSPSELLMGVTQRHLTAKCLPSQGLGANAAKYNPVIPNDRHDSGLTTALISELYSGAVLQKLVHFNSSLILRRGYETVNSCFAVSSSNSMRCTSLFNYHSLAIQTSYDNEDAIYNGARFFPSQFENTVESLIMQDDSWLDICCTLGRVLEAASQPSECKKLLRLVRCLWQMRGVCPEKFSKSFVHVLVELLKVKLVKGSAVVSHCHSMCYDENVIKELILMSSIILRCVRPTHRTGQSIPSFSVSPRHECILQNLVLFRMLLRDFLYNSSITAASYSQILNGVLEAHFDPFSKFTSVNKKLCEQSGIFQLLLGAVCNIKASNDKSLLLFGVFFHSLVKRDLISRKDFFFLFHLGCILSTSSTYLFHRLGYSAMNPVASETSVKGAEKDATVDELLNSRTHCRFIRQCIFSLIQCVSFTNIAVNVTPNILELCRV